MTDKQFNEAVAAGMRPFTPITQDEFQALCDRKILKAEREQHVASSTLAVVLKVQQAISVLPEFTEDERRLFRNSVIRTYRLRSEKAERVYNFWNSPEQVQKWLYMQAMVVQ